MKTFMVSGECTTHVTVTLSAADEDAASAAFADLCRNKIDVTDEGLLDVYGIDSFEVASVAIELAEEIE